MGSLPYEPHPHDDTKGDACPPLDSPAGHPNVLSNDGYFRGALLRNMFRQASRETCTPLTGR